MPLFGNLSLVVAGGLGIVIAVLALRNRPRPGSTALGAFGIVIALWSFMHLGRHFAAGDLSVILTKLQFVALAPASFLSFAFVLAYIGSRGLLTRKWLAVLFAWPAFIAISVWLPVPVQQGLSVWALLEAQRGVIYWMHVGLSFGLLITGSVLVVRHVLRTTGLFRRQGLAILGAMVAGLAAALIAVFELFGDLHVHAIPIGLIVMSLFLLWALTAADLTKVTPIARRAIIRAIEAGVVVINADWQVVALNPAAESLFGIDQHPITGKPFGEVFAAHPALVDWVHPVPHRGDTRSKAFQIDDRVLQADLSTLFDRENRFVGSVLLFNDITDQRRRRNELERQNERLDEFTEMVSHDLRNPLSVAAGSIDLARQTNDNEHLETAEEALYRMETLIEKLRALARSGLKIEETSPVSLTQMGQDSFRMIGAKEASLQLEADFEFLASPERLRQVFENLFRNAVEHGGAEVSIRVGPLADGFFVADDGPGIGSDASTEIFEPGYSESEGTGLGLAIVAEIVEAHDWSIEVTESADGGARFEITGVEIPE